MKLICPFCSAGSAPATTGEPRWRCPTCQRLFFVPSGPHAGEVVGEKPSPEAVLRSRPNEAPWKIETEWMALLQRSSQGRSAPAFDQAWEAYVALRRPDPTPPTTDGLDPLDGPGAGSCVLCGVVDPCPRCRPGRSTLDRRRSLYAVGDDAARRELAAMTLACGELRECWSHLAASAGPDLVLAAAALASGQPRRAAELAPSDPSGRWVRARALVASGDGALALSCLDRIDSPRASYLRACALAASGREDAARETLKLLATGSDPLSWRACVALAALDRIDPGTVVERPPAGPAQIVHLARSLLRAGFTDRALELLPVDSPWAEVWLWRGHALVRKSNEKGALLAYEQALEIQPWHEDALASLAHLALKAGQPQRVTDLEPPLQPGHPDRRFAYFQALCRLRVGKAGQGLTQLAQLARSSDDAGLKQAVASLQCQIGAMLFSAGRYSEAIGAFRVTGEADAQTRSMIGEAYLRLGVAELGKGKAEEACASLAQAMESRGSAVDRYYAGLADLASGRLAQGASHLEGVETDGTVGPRARLHRILAMMASGRGEEARALAPLPVPEPTTRLRVLTDWLTVLRLLEQRDYTRALASTRALLEAPEPLAEFPRARDTVARVRRRLARRLGEADVEASSSGSLPGVTLSASTNVVNGIRAFEAGRFEEARDSLRRAIDVEKLQEARALLETFYGLWLSKLVEAGDVTRALQVCADAESEGQCEGDWELWRWALLLDGTLSPDLAGPLDRAEQQVRHLELHLEAAICSKHAARIAPVIRQNLAIRSHRLAADLEEAGNGEAARAMWVRAVNYWLFLLGKGRLEDHLVELNRRQFGETDPSLVGQVCQQFVFDDLAGLLWGCCQHHERAGEPDRVRFFQQLREPLLVHLKNRGSTDPQIRNELAGLHYERAGSLVEAGQFEQAAELLRQAVELMPELELLFRAVAVVYLRWARREYNEGNLALTRELIAIAAAADPYNEEAESLVNELPAERASARFKLSARVAESYARARERIRWYQIGRDTVMDDVRRIVRDLLSRGLTGPEIVQRLLEQSELAHIDPERLEGFVQSVQLEEKTRRFAEKRQG